MVIKTYFVKFLYNRGGARTVYGGGGGGQKGGEDFKRVANENSGVEDHYK